MLQEFKGQVFTVAAEDRLAVLSRACTAMVKLRATGHKVYTFIIKPLSQPIYRHVPGASV